MEMSNGGVELTLSDPNGVEIASNFSLTGGFDADIRDFTLPTSGTYTVTVDGRGDATGDYTLGYTNFNQGAVSFSDNDSRATSLDFAGDGEGFFFDAEAGDIITSFADNFTDGGMQISLVDPNGEIVTSDFSLTGNFDAEIRDFVLPESGTYLFLVEGYDDGQGDYTFGFTNFTQIVEPISDNQGVATRLDFGGDGQAFSFEAEAGDIVTAFDDNFTDGGMSITILDPNGVEVASSFSLTGNFDTEIRDLLLSETGTYLILVEGRGDSIGDHTFGFTNFTQIATPIFDNQSVATRLDFGGDGQAFSFEAEAEDIITAFVDNFTDGGMQIRILDSNNAEVASNFSLTGNFDAKIRDLELSATATYLALVEGYGDSIGDYTFGFTNFTQNPRSIAIGQTVNDTLEFTGDGEAYRFDGTAGAIVTAFADNSATGGLQMKIFDPNGDEIASKFSLSGGFDTEISDLTLPVDGTYTVLLEGYGDSTGNYALSLTA